MEQRLITNLVNDFMKRFLVTTFLVALGVNTSLHAQPQASYINTGSVTVPVNIDATNFLNLGTIDFSSSASTYSFYDVVNYTNKNSMVSSLGWIFDTTPSALGSESAANVFVNTSPAIISSTSPSVRYFDVRGFPLFTPQLIGPALKVWANNLTNQGTLHSGVGGLISLSGKNVNLKGGLLDMDGVNASSTNLISIINAQGSFSTVAGFYPGLYLGGIVDTYWGVGNDTNQTPRFLLPAFAQSSVFNETNAASVNLGGGILNIRTSLTLRNPSVYIYQNFVGGNISNIVTQIVMIGNGNTDTNTTIDVRFADAQELQVKPSDFRIPTIQLLSVSPSVNGGTRVTNSLYITDDFATRTNGVNIVKTNSQSLSGRPGYSPTNYILTRSYPLISPWNLVPPANNQSFITSITNGFGLGNTNSYAAYGATLVAATASPDPAHPLLVTTNLPGRIEINAGNLDLNRVRIQGANYLRLSASNNFVGSASAQISAPILDINLTRNDGISLTASNLVLPYLNQMSGTVDMYSSMFTNLFPGLTNIIGGVTNILGATTNRIHLFMVESSISSISPAAVQNLQLTATNQTTANFQGKVFISDILNVSSNLLILADQLTLTTNAPTSINTNGQINLGSDNNWATNFPLLTKMTNGGQITMPGIGLFYGMRGSPFYGSTFNEPYKFFVNHGSVAASGETFWADYFENSGNTVVTNNVVQAGGSFFVFTNSSVISLQSLIYPSSFVEGVISAYAGPVFVNANNAKMINGEIFSQNSDISISANSLTVSNHSLVTAGALNLVISNSFNSSPDGSGRLSTNYWQVGQGFNLANLPSDSQKGDVMGTTLLSVVQPHQDIVSTWAGLDFGNTPFAFTNNMAVGHLVLDGLDATSIFTFSGSTSGNALYVDLLELQDFATNRVSPNLSALNVDPDGVDAGVTNMVIYFADAQIRLADGSVLDVSEKLNHANNDRLRWVSGYNDGRFSSTNFAYPSGTIYSLNRALVTSTTIDSDGDGTPNGYDSTPFGGSAPVTAFDPFNLSVRSTNNPPNSIVISWPATKGATNYVESKSSLGGSAWISAFVTNSPVTGTITATLPSGVGVNYYRVRVVPQQ